MKERDDLEEITEEWELKEIEAARKEAKEKGTKPWDDLKKELGGQKENFNGLSQN